MAHGSLPRRGGGRRSRSTRRTDAWHSVEAWERCERRASRAARAHHGSTSAGNAEGGTSAQSLAMHSMGVMVSRWHRPSNSSGPKDRRLTVSERKFRPAGLRSQLPPRRLRIPSRNHQGAGRTHQKQNTACHERKKTTSFEVNPAYRSMFGPFRGAHAPRTVRGATSTAELV